MPTESNPPQSASVAANFSRMSTGRIEVVARPTITSAELHKALDHILELHGCMACGLNGWDILFRPQDPIILERFAELGGITDVVIRPESIADMAIRR